MSLLRVLVAVALVATLADCGDSEEPSRPAERDGPDPFYGIAPVGVLNDADLARMAEGGIGSYRLSLGWPSIEASKGTYDWAPVDALVTSLARHGIQPRPSLIGTPSFYAEEPTIGPTVSEEALDGWASFVRAAARRYGPGGKFWTELAEAEPEVAPTPVRSWEIWNEPNSSLFWKPQPDPPDYATLLERSASALRSVDPDARIVTGGIFATPQSEGAIVSYDFIEGVYDALGEEGALIDSIGIHPYGADVGEVIDQLDGTREAIDDSGGDAGISVTEIGWGSDPDVPNYLAKSRQQQAKLLSDTFEKLLRGRRRWGLDGVAWFTWRDSTEPVGECVWCETAGLVDSDRDTKPAWRAFTKITGGEP